MGPECPAERPRSDPGRNGSAGAGPGITPTPMEAPMDDPVTREEEQEQIPLGQRLYDRPMLLLVAGIVIMAVFYTGWGMWEVLSLTPSPLP
jgi:hypothetical protein